MKVYMKNIMKSSLKWLPKSLLATYRGRPIAPSDKSNS